MIDLDLAPCLNSTTTLDGSISAVYRWVVSNEHHDDLAAEVIAATEALASGRLLYELFQSLIVTVKSPEFIQMWGAKGSAEQDAGKSSNPDTFELLLPQVS